MRVSYGLPTHRVDLGDEFIGPGAVGELAGAAEDAGFDAVYTTDHPFPGDDWLAHGGHHALDPLVALAFTAAATSRVRLHCNLFVLAYRNPFLAAKGIATLDTLSGGRTLIGLGAGYLEPEFEALGIPFDDRTDRMDEALAAMEAAWTGESVTLDGPRFPGTGQHQLSAPHPSVRVHRSGSAATVAGPSDGRSRWRTGGVPFPSSPMWPPGPAPRRWRRPPISVRRSTRARRHAETVGRTEPLTVCFIPEGLSMGGGAVDESRVVASIGELAAVGVHWVAVSLSGEAQGSTERAALDRFGSLVLPAVAGL